ncbi:MAG: exo-alpha-sialidase [Chloroflexi bacterium]|nr:exo-alpha-sialidase [Chloroflexota bacterium]
MRRFRRIPFRRVSVFALVLATIVAVSAPDARSQPTPPGGQIGNRAIQESLNIADGRATPSIRARYISGGVLDTALQLTGRLSAARGPGGGGPPPVAVAPRTNGCQNTFNGNPANIRVTQDCSLRRQAETFIAINPTDPNNLIAGQNDSRVGFNHTGIAYSLDRGRTWGDFLPPFWGYVAKDGHTFDAASDPAVAFDSRGNAYYAAVLFDLNSPASAFLVTKSNKEMKGSLFHTPSVNAPSSPATQLFRSDPVGVVASDNDPTIAHDKEFIAADQNAGSPKRDYVYATWTRFRQACGSGGTGYCESPIYFSQSTDGGATWSAGVEISGNNAAICGFGDFFDPGLSPSKCDFDQGSWPVVGPDGTINVIFNNGNALNPDNFSGGQQLFVKCPVSKNCTVAANWTAPVKVADDFNNQPFSCPQAPGRQCLPPNSFRMNDFPSMGINRSNGHLYAVWADFRNGGPCAGPPTALPVLPCGSMNNDVFFSKSTDGGVTWSAASKVNQDMGEAAQVFPWVAVGGNGTVYVGYYDRRYGCETFGCQDFTLSWSGNGGSTWTDIRITTSSMQGPEANVVQAGFLGDYNGVAADDQGVVMVWSDTRGLYGQNEQDMYFAALGPLSGGGGRGGR